MVKQKDIIPILIQARVNSTRLPGKIFFTFFNDTILDRIIKICKKINNNEDIYILTGSKTSNKKIENIAIKNKVKIFYGNEKNVYSRYKKFAIKNKNYKYLIRVTADNYLIQPKIILDLIKKIKNNDFEYLFIKPLSHYGGEIISTKLFSKFKKISKMAKEHVTWDFRKNKNVKKFSFEENYLGLNHSKSLTLDTLEDFNLLKKLEKKYPNLKKLNNYKELRSIL